MENADFPIYRSVKNPNLAFDLEFEIHNLLREEPFFAKISRRMKKVATESIPTAGVRLNKETLSYELLYNSKFFAELSSIHRLGVLMHEFYHVALGHCFERNPKNVPPKKANVAMDLAINGLPGMPEKLPEGALIPGSDPYASLPAGNSMEWYLSNLPKDDGNDSFDDHSQWNGDPSDGEGKGNGQGESEQETDDAVREIAASKLRDIIQKAVDESNKEQINGSNGWGSVSSSIQKVIQEKLIAKLDPKKVLGYFIKSSVRAEKTHRITKINRRWAYIHPGRYFNRRANIAIAIDQSGSVSDEMLSQFFDWLNDFSKFATFTVIPFDDTVFEEKIFVWQKGEKRKRERVRNGGTNFDAPTDYINRRSSTYDGLIVCTDLCAPKPKNCKVQRLWVTDRRCAAHPYFQTSERILVVD